MSNPDASPEKVSLPDYHGHEARLTTMSRLPGMPPVPTGTINVRSMTPEESARQAAAEQAEQARLAQIAAAAATPKPAPKPRQKKATAAKKSAADSVKERI